MIVQTIKLLNRVDPILVETYVSKLLGTLAPGKSDPNKRDRVIRTTVFAILEGSEIVDLTATSWVERLASITTAIGCSTVEVLEVMVVQTVDRFGTSTELLKSGFASGLLAKEDLWSADLSWGLMVAATFGVGEASPEIKAQGALTIAEWLDQKHRMYLPVARRDDQSSKYYLHTN